MNKVAIAMIVALLTSCQAPATPKAVPEPPPRIDCNLIFPAPPPAQDSLAP